MNCNIELIEKSLKKEFPYVVKIKELVESAPSVDIPIPHYGLDIYIKESFFSQLQNNGPLRNIIVTSFTNESTQIVNNICPELGVSSDNLIISFISDTGI
jgi:hypothetical protein